MDSLEIWQEDWDMEALRVVSSMKRCLEKGRPTTFVEQSPGGTSDPGAQLQKESLARQVAAAAVCEEVSEDLLENMLWKVFKTSHLKARRGSRERETQK